MTIVISISPLNENNHTVLTTVKNTNSDYEGIFSFNGFPKDMVYLFEIKKAILLEQESTLKFLYRDG